MAVKKWSWTTTNPYVNDPGLSGSYAQTGATAAETKKAYAALVNKGPTSDFSYKVWNDMCAKIRDLNKAWQTNNYFGVVWPSVWMKSPYVSDYPSESTYEYENGVAGGTKGRITPFMINMAAGALIPTAVRPWSTKLGRDTIQKGDICYAEYFLWIAETINHWCDLSPEWWKFTDQFKLSAKCHPALARSILIDPNCLKSTAGVAVWIDMDTSIPMKAPLRMVYRLNADEIVMLEPVPISSLMNFLTLNINCKVWDKIPIYLCITYGAKHKGDFKFAMLPPVHIRALQKYSLQTEINTCLVSDLLGMGIRLSGKQNAVIRPDMAKAYGFSLKGTIADQEGKAKVRFLRPLPLSARTEYSSSVRCLIEFEGIEIMFMKDGTIRFSDTIGLDITGSGQMDHVGEMAVVQEDIPIQDAATAKLDHGAERIIIHGNTIESIVGNVQESEHKGTTKIQGSQDIQKVASEVLSHEGQISGTVGSAEMSFANEETVKMQNCSFGVANGEIDLSFQDTQAMSVQGSLDTREEITLGDAPPFEVEAEGNVTTKSAASIEQNRVIENAADSVIQVLESGEISFGLNANLEIESIAATISSAAGLAVMQLSGIEADADVETIETAIAVTMARKLVEGASTVGTAESGELLKRLMRFVESTNSMIRAESESAVLNRLPRSLHGKPTLITTATDTFLDASYIRGESLLADTKIMLDTDVSPVLVNSRAYLAAMAIISIWYEARLERLPAASLEGNALAETDSEAGVVLARSVLIFARTVDDQLALVIEKDEILASDFERTLTFQ